MFSSEQRIKILKWGSAFVLGLSIIPLIGHGIFFIILFQYYIPIAIITFTIYYSYSKIKKVDVYDQDVKDVLFSLLPKKKR